MADRQADRRGFARHELPLFGRGFFRSPEPAMRIGDGELGGKARGLIALRDLLAARLDAESFPGLRAYVPKLAVLATGGFEAFMAGNRLWEEALAGRSDQELADRFQRGDLPVEILGDLRSLVEEVRQPLAVRSSSLLEDALFRPFAGVYATKMLPNNQPDADSRFRRLVEAIKLVWASTFFGRAQGYQRAAASAGGDERMAVVVQEVVGARHQGLFYPHLSVVARSWNFFPVQGAAPRDGVVSLALGLGKTIVDGGSCWSYSPARPQAPPPFSMRELLRSTQLRFWAVNMGQPPAYDPIAETEYLSEASLAAADYDGVLGLLASTYDREGDRLIPGTTVAGPRVLDFAPLLGRGGLPLNELVVELLRLGEEALGEAVEIELAVVLPDDAERQARCGVLQLRPMLVSEQVVTIEEEELTRPDLLLASDRVMGNGVVGEVRDILYVRPEVFDARQTRRVAQEIDRLNRRLLDQQRPYLLIGFGRWGSSDPWLGIPVAWGQVAGARVIVEATLPGMDVEPSQGAHFFHNLVSFQVSYLCVRHGGGAGIRRGIDWDWLQGCSAEAESETLRLLRLDEPLRVKVDGRTGRGGIWRPSDGTAVASGVAR